MPLSLYVHLPWCIHKCPYCDFNSHAVGDGMPENDYIKALLCDLERECAAQEQVRNIESIFIGGGTPSLFSPDAIGKLLEGVARHMSCPRDLEITMEANPGTVERGHLAGFRKAGVNRLSLGIQSFSDSALQILERIHNSEEAREAVRQAQRQGFDNLNLDLMYGLPEQDVAAACRDLQQAIALEPTHISWYQLNIEPNTAFYSNPPQLPSEAMLEDIQSGGEELLRRAGYKQYEISAWALPGRECLHNLHYWHFGDYLGIGAGAHGKHSQLGEPSIVRREKSRLPQNYLRSFHPDPDRAPDHAPDNVARPKPRQTNEEQREPGVRQWRLGAEELPLEFMMNALRLCDGFAAQLFTERTGLPLRRIQSTLDELRGQGLLYPQTEWIQTTPLGQRFLNEVLQLFMPADDTMQKSLQIATSADAGRQPRPTGKAL